MNSAPTPPHDWSRIAQSASFRRLMHTKEKFVIPILSFAFVFYFALPVLTAWFEFLNRPAIGAITWAWLFAFAQFVMTWTLCWLYSRKALQFDHQEDAIQRELGIADRKGAPRA